MVSCLSDGFAPRAGEAAVRVLERLGCRVAFPKAQTCCGQPMVNGGYDRHARALAKRTAKVFGGFDHVVSPSGSCVATIRNHYPRLLGDEHPFPARVWDFVGFVREVLEVRDLAALGCAWPGAAACHRPCHAAELPYGDQTAALLAGVAGLTLAPLEDPAECCGFGGTFAVKFPTLSGAMGRDKAARIADQGARWVVCNEAGCGLQIAGALERAGVYGVQLKHAAEIVAEGLGLMPRPPLVAGAGRP